MSKIHYSQESLFQAVAVARGDHGPEARAVLAFVVPDATLYPIDVMAIVGVDERHPQGRFAIDRASRLDSPCASLDVGHA